MAPVVHTDKETSLLEILSANSLAGQRDMAEASGLSLGMTNILLKKLSARGWLLMRRLTARKVQYVLTPEGLRELSQRSYRYLKKSIRSVADCRVQLETLVIQAKASGAKGLYLVSPSDLDFVLESICRQQDFPFSVLSGASDSPGWFAVHGENEPAKSPNVLEYMEAIPQEVRKI